MQNKTAFCEVSQNAGDGRYRTRTAAENTEKLAGFLGPDEKNDENGKPIPLYRRLLDAWSLLDERQKLTLVKRAEQTAGTATLPHRSTLPAVDESALRLIPQAEAAARLGVTEATVRTWVKRGWITPPERVEGRPYYPQDAVDQATRARAKRHTQHTETSDD